jgi:Trypsin-like peptidase domain
MNEEQLRGLTVLVIAGEARGTGFFVANGTVLTCAHVVRAMPTGPRPKVVWNGEKYEADVVSEELSSGQEGNGPLKDAAVLRIALLAHPRAEIDSECKTGDELHAYGYPASKPLGEPALGRCEGTDGRGLIKFRDTLVDHGMSGAPLLNLTTGRVCGMVRATRDKDAPVGGFAIHGRELVRFLAPEPHKTDIFQGLPSRWATQVEAFLVQYLGTQGNPVPFGGRDPQIKALDDWLEDASAPRYGLIEARAGLGKSALLARWVDSLRSKSDGYNLVYFPISARWQTNSQTAIFQSIAFRLSRLFCEPAPQSEDLRDLTAVTSKYFHRAAREMKGLLVVVDGLDEATGWEAGTDFFPPRGHGNVRALVAARPLGSRDWLGRLGWNTRGVARSFDLRELDRHAVAECLRQMGNLLAPLADRFPIVETLYEKSGGDPLVLKLYVEEIQKYVDRSSGFDEAALKQMRPGLAGFFDYWFRDQVNLWGEDRIEREPRVRAMMGLCSLAHGPLQQQDLRSLKPEIFAHRGDVDRAAEDLQRLLIGDGRAKGYVVSHPRLADFVREELLEKEELQIYESILLGYCERTVRNLKHSEDSRVPDYVVRWYTTHLIQASSSCIEFLPLLSLDWCAEWERVEGTPAGFLNDLEKAWQQASSPEFIGVRIRIALLRSSILTRGRGIGMTLFAQSLAAGLISPTLAEVIAAQREDASERFHYLLLIAKNEDQPSSRLYREVLPAARLIGDDYQRVIAFSAVAELLSPKDRESTLLEALVVVRQMDDDYSRATALIAVAELLTSEEGDLLQETLTAARLSENGYERVLVLTVVAERLGTKDRECALREALEDARQIKDDFKRAIALSAVAKRLNAAEERDKELHEALATTRQIASESERAAALNAVAEELSQEDGDLLREALAAARQIEDCSGRAKALTTVAQRLGPKDRERALQEALQAARQIGNDPPEGTIFMTIDSDREIALSAVAQQLSQEDEELLQDALAVARLIGDDSERAIALSAVAQRLPQKDRESALQEALMAARHGDDSSERSRALSELAERLGSKEQESALREALECARQIGDDPERAIALSAVAKRLDAEDREKALQEALAVVRQIANEPKRTTALNAVAEQLDQEDGDLLKEALTVARQTGSSSDRAIGLTAVAHWLSQKDRESALQEALEAGRQIGNDSKRTIALSAVAERMEGENRQEVLEEALVITRQIRKDAELAEALISLAQRLCPEDRDLLNGMLPAAHQIRNDADRASVLIAVAQWLGVEDREKALQEALAIARQIGSDYHRAWVLAAAADRLDPEDQQRVWQEALVALRQIGDDFQRALALSGMAERLGPDRRDLLKEMLAVARQIEEGSSRTRALSSVAERMSPEDREEVLQDMLVAARSIEDDDFDRASELSAVATKCTVRMQADLANDLLAVISEEPALGGVASFAAQWLPFCRFRDSPPHSELSIWIEPLSRCARSQLIAALGALAPAIEATGGQKLLLEMTEAIVEVGRWWR